MMKLAMPLGLWFVVEYFITVLSTRYITLAVIRTPMMISTPVLLFLILRKLRDTYFPDDEFSRFRGWYYGVQTMFFAGLIEAVGVVIYNKWISPDNLAEMQRAMEAQYQEVISMFEANALAMKQFPTMLDTLKQMQQAMHEAPVGTAFEAAINLLSSDIMYGMLWSFIFCLFLHRNPQGQQTDNKKK